MSFLGFLDFLQGHSVGATLTVGAGLFWAALAAYLIDANLRD
jgi:hypothetical protein